MRFRIIALLLTSTQINGCLSISPSASTSDRNATNISTEAVSSNGKSSKSTEPAPAPAPVADASPSPAPAPAPAPAPTSSDTTTLSAPAPTQPVADSTPTAQATAAGTGYVVTSYDTASDRADRAFGVALLPADSNGDHEIISVGQNWLGNASQHGLMRHDVAGNLAWKKSVYFDNQNMLNDSDHAYSVARQSDGKVVTAGFNCTSGKKANTCNFALTRWTAAGVLDTTFGTGGKVSTGFGTTSNALAYKVLLSGPKIIAVGEQRSATAAIAIAQYTSAGVLDATFGSSGKVLVEYDLIPKSGALQADGKILVVGRSRDQARFVVARFNANGSIDASFGTNGVVAENIGYRPIAKAVVVQDTGKIVVIGQVGEFNADVFIKRYLANGAVDASFGTAGLIQQDFGSQEDPNAVLSLGDGNAATDDAIVLATARYVSGVPSVGVAKLAADGSLVWIAKPAIEKSAIPYDIQLQSNGKLLVVGEATLMSSASPDFLAVRLKADGSLDLTF